MKKIIYTDYIRKRMKERGVSEKQVEYALKHRDITLPGKKRNRKRIFSQIGSKNLNLVIKETYDKIILVTVVWRGE